MKLLQIEKSIINFSHPEIIMTAYRTSLEHLLDELRRIDLIVSFHCRKFKKEHGEGADGFQGLFISDNEINEILRAHPFSMNVYPDEELEKINAAVKKIGEKKLETLKEGKSLRLQTLSELFNLTPFEIDTILICLAPELDLRYEKLYSYMHDDITRKRPTVDLVMKLLCNSQYDKFEARKYFSLQAPLLQNRLLSFTGDDQLPLLSRSLRIDERITSFLLGASGIDNRIRNITSLIKPRRSFDDIISNDDHKTGLMEFMKTFSSMKNPAMFFFQGPYGCGKKMTAESICREMGTSLLVVGSKGLKGSESFETLRLIFREAVLEGSNLYFEGFDSLLEKESGVSVPDLVRYIDSFPIMIFLSGENSFESRGIHYHNFIILDFPLPSFALRKQLWKNFLNGDAGNADIDALAVKFKFSGGQIKDAIFTARNAAASKGKPVLSMEDLYQGCRAQSGSSISALAKKIHPRYAWEDIILPKDTKNQLKEVAGHIKYRGIVYSDWGFDRKLSIGKGLNILFSGPSGTGKTMAAEIISKEVQLDIYKIDLSNVVSKYIGETEKNLSKIFKEAETSNAIIFFDEADALFGKRSEVKDAHDRYANIEIGYLLQKMEEYDGVVILATNLSKNIDDAFLRRMQIVIEFPFPDENQRKLIWKGIFPKEAPIVQDIDYKFLSEKIKLAGGNIKNMALSAAFYAAENSGEIDMQHIMHAAKREYQKIGKPFLKADLEPYYQLIATEQ
jgi:SpoVK/Ycf46/Vps4 family AAA+-type ATPase